MVMVAAVAALTVAGLAYAAPPSDQGAFPLSSVPDCKTAATDTGGAHICKVRAAVGGAWQASVGEWIVVRAGTGDPNPAVCQSIQAGAVVTITIDGNALPVDLIPCAFSPALGVFFVDWRALSQPLTPGVHNIVETWSFPNGALGIPPGTVITFTPTLTVGPNG
jgi:hypothetical protein